MNHPTSPPLSANLEYQLLSFRPPVLALAVIRLEFPAKAGTVREAGFRKLIELVGASEDDLAACEAMVEELVR